MAEARSAATEARVSSQVLVRDLAALLGFSLALAVTAGVIRTPMHLPGHSALFWLPVLVLAGAYRRPGMAVATGALGGMMGMAGGGIRGLELAGLLAAAGMVEAFGIGQTAGARGLRMLLAGVGAHLGKLAIKAIAAGASGLPLNETGLTLLPTLALYAAFGLTASGIAWGLLAAWLRLRGSQRDTEHP